MLDILTDSHLWHSSFCEKAKKTTKNLFINCISHSGIDPDGGAIGYSISGPVFSVDRDTGVVRLRQELDREKQDTIEVIISITGMWNGQPMWPQRIESWVRVSGEAKSRYM